MPGTDRDLLYITGKKRLCAVDPTTGQEIWNAAIPAGGWFGSGVVTLLCDGARVYVGRNGTVTAFDAISGQRLWSTHKPDSSHSTPMLAMAGLSVDAGAIVAQEAAAQAQQSDAGTAGAG